MPALILDADPHHEAFLAFFACGALTAIWPLAQLIARISNRVGCEAPAGRGGMS